MERRTDIVLLTVTIMLVTIGLGMLYSTSAVVAQARYGDSLYFVKRQVVWAALGGVALWGAWVLPYRAQRRWALLLALGTMVALVAVLVSGKQVGGARRWLALGPWSTQPSEVAKYVLLLCVARLLSRPTVRIDSLTATYLPLLGLIGGFVLPVFRQPDLGTALVLALTSGLLLFLAGVPWSYLGATALATLPGLYWAVFHVSFRFNRVWDWINPWRDPLGSGYQAIQSSVALGQGHWLGMGLGQSSQKLFYLPEAHTDFIFAVIGEELGWLGAVGLMGLFGLLLWRILRIAQRCEEPFGAYLSLGIFVLLASQIVMNLGVVTGLLPTKGLPLSLISVGGSNLLVSLLAIGTMLNIAERGRE